ncbi:MAG: hypothetical protein ACHQPI_02430 [Thermoanaerobaculia bacterium]
MERPPRDPANRIAPAAVAALFLVRFAPFLVGGTLYSRDAGFFFAPWRALLPKLSANGFPFWNDLLSNGRAFAADPNAAVFWPLAPLAFLLSPSALALANVALLLGLFYVSLRAIRLGAVPAAAGTAVLLFSGVLQTIPLLAGLPSAAPLAPAAVAFWALGAGRPPAARFLALGGGALALSFFGGEPSVTATGGAACVALAFGRLAVRPRPSPGETLRRLTAIGGAVLLAAGLAAVQLVPAWGLLRRSTRGTELQAEQGALYWSVRPSRLLTLLEPRLPGDPGTESTAGYWGSGTFDGGQPYYPDIALGLVPLLLAAVALGVPRGRAALGLAGGAALLSFGRFLPGYPVFARRLPIFRYPEKWWVVATLALSMAAAVGVGRLLAMDRDERDRTLRMLRRASLALAAPLGAVALLAFLSPRALRTVLWEASLGTGPAPASLVASVLWPLALGGAAAMLVAALFSELVRRGRASRLALLLILSVLFLADGARRVAGTLPAGPPGLFSTRTPDVGRVAEESMRGRFFDDRADDRATGVRRTLEGRGFDPLRAAAGVFWGIPYALENDVDRMTPPESVGAVFEAESLPWGEEKVTRLREAGVAVVRTAATPLDPPGVEEIARIGSGGDRIMRIVPTRPEFLFAAEAVVARNAHAARRLIRSNLRDPLRSAVIEVPGVPESSRAGGAGTAEVVARSNRRVALQVTVSPPVGILVTTRSFGAEWTAAMDGRPLPLFRCDGYLTAAFVPPGEHRIDFEYDTGPFLRGGIVSALSLAVAALCVFWSRTQ